MVTDKFDKDVIDGFNWFVNCLSLMFNFSTGELQLKTSCSAEGILSVGIPDPVELNVVGLI